MYPATLSRPQDLATDNQVEVELTRSSDGMGTNQDLTLTLLTSNLASLGAPSGVHKGIVLDSKKVHYPPPVMLTA